MIGEEKFRELLEIRKQYKLSLVFNFAISFVSLLMIFSVAKLLPLSELLNAEASEGF